MNTVALLGNPLTSMFLASIYVKLDIVAVTSTGSNDETAPKAEAVLMLLLYLLSQDSVVHSVPEIVALVRRASFSSFPPHKPIVVPNRIQFLSFLLTTAFLCCIP